MKKRAVACVIAVLAASAFVRWIARTPSAGVEARPMAAPAAGAARVAAAQADANPRRTAYFGDLHVHTSWSLDAYASGNRNDPRIAYRFGRGEAIATAGGRKAQLKAPLDFMAVTDHDSVFGEVPLCLDPFDSAYRSPVCRELLDTMPPPRTAEACESDLAACTAQATDRRQGFRVQTTWRQVRRNADEFYRPGTFTTLPGYEFTSGIQGMLHRNVIFRGERLPDTILRASDVKGMPERLWDWLEHECVAECQVVVIPHNTNWNQGIMLGTTNSDGSPFTQAGLKRRASTEGLIEVFQHKGNSECSLGLGTTDEECGFELALKPCRPGQQAAESGAGMPVCGVEAQFVRNALKTGLALLPTFGVNPYKYGFIGSTDTHASLAGGTDDKQNVLSHYNDFDDTPQERLRNRWAEVVTAQPSTWGPQAATWSTSLLWNPGGLAGVWAEENTRTSIFAALRRRETFATSGTRIRVRLFAGWNYPSNLDTRATFVEEVYAGGVAMGGDLPAKPASARAPRLVVWAVKDARSASLQKIQIVKGWAKAGQTFERTFDAVCADGLTPDPRTHLCRDNGATVNLSDCSYPHDKGAAELSATWTDPEFDPAADAFYYARVLENPTCRWSTFDAIAMKVPPADGVPPTVKERAWSSPILYTPAAR